MFNAEKLLGGLIRGSIRGSRGGLGSLLTSGAALGALGVAMEAVEHYMNRPGATGAPPRPPAVPASPTGSAPPSPLAAGPRSAAPPPPPPPMPPPTAGPAPAAAGSDAVLLIRAMIAAANADGVIDPAERRQILKRLQAIDLSPQEQVFITRELLAPTDLETIVAGVRDPEMASQVYTVSLLAIDVDTPQEVSYLTTLAERLGLDAATVAQIHRRLETD